MVASNAGAITIGKSPSSIAHRIASHSRYADHVDQTTKECAFGVPVESTG